MNMTNARVAATTEAHWAGDEWAGHSLSASFFAEGDRLDAEGLAALDDGRHRGPALAWIAGAGALVVALAVWLLGVL